MTKGLCSSYNENKVRCHRMWNRFGFRCFNGLFGIKRCPILQGIEHEASRRLEELHKNGRLTL